MFFYPFLHNAEIKVTFITVSKLRRESTPLVRVSLSARFMARLNFVLHSVIKIVPAAKSNMFTLTTVQQLLLVLKFKQK